MSGPVGGGGGSGSVSLAPVAMAENGAAATSVSEKPLSADKKFQENVKKSKSSSHLRLRKTLDG